MNIAKSYDFFHPEDCKGRIHIIGCGAIGSTLAEELVRYGIEKITLYDFDAVESHNIANQIYTEADIGKTKVQALSEYLLKINPELSNHLKVVEKGYINQRLSGYVFLCVDNIELRRKIVEENQHNQFILGMFDFRMRLTDAQHYAADWSNETEVRSLLNSMNFSHEEAKQETPVSACNLTLSVVSTVRLIVSLGVVNFINFVKEKKLNKMILMDASTFALNAY